MYPHFDENDLHVANCIRRKGEKAFYWEGEVARARLFGRNFFPAGGKAITIHEGRDDAMAAYEMTGCRFANVSVCSASSAVKECSNDFEYLDSFDKIVICFDSDKPGQEAAEKVAGLFQPGKVHILTLQKAKDANEYAQFGISREFISEWFSAPVYTPSGLKLGKNMWDEIINRPELFSVPYPFSNVQSKTYGIRSSELVIVTADTGVGKTQFLKEIEYSLLMNEDLIKNNMGVGFLHFEETNYDTVLGLMSIHHNKPYHIPDTARTIEELRKAYDDVIANERVVIWDHFGSNDINEVLSKIRHMAALGCKYIVLDHLSIVVSDQSGDERKQLDEISTKLKTLCMERDIACIAVIHQNRQGQIRGTAGVEQLANIVIKLDREKEDASDWRRNVTNILIQKNRFCGQTGPAGKLFYNSITGRLEELTVEQCIHYDNGGNGAGLELAF